MSTTQAEINKAQALRDGGMPCYKIAIEMKRSVWWVKHYTVGKTRNKKIHCAADSENSFHCSNPAPLPAALMIMRSVI